MPGQLKQGDTFLYKPAVLPTHLFIVVSNPQKHDELVLVSSVTTARTFVDPACVLDIGDHPFIEHRSFVLYEKAQRWTKAFVQQLRPMEPLTAVVLARVVAGAAASRFLTIEHYDFLAAQGLFDELREE